MSDWSSDVCSSDLVLAELMDNGDFERHINRVRRKKRRELGQD